MVHPQGAALERALRAKLAATLADVGWPSKPPAAASSTRTDADAVIRLASPTGARPRLFIHVKSELRPGTFVSWADALHTKAGDASTVAVLAMPSVSPRLADLCRRAGWSWIDLAGNCRIDVPGMLHIERSGIPSIHRPPRSIANLGTAAAARVVRTLLAPAHATRCWTQRDLQQYTCWHLRNDEPVSLGLVNKVLRHLRDEGFVAEAEEGGARLSDPLGLLNAWRGAYRFDRHERRSYFTLLKGAELDKALYKIACGAADVAAYAAFSAAERQAPHVRQPKTWLYIAAGHVEAFVRHAQAKEVDSGENVVVLVPDDSGVFLTFTADVEFGEQRVGCTDPVQTYVDVSRSGGRGEEAAQAVLEQRLLPVWKAAGIA